MEHIKCLIVGSGPAGYTAAIYAGRANLNPVEYCGMQTGGQLTQTTIVENFPGYPEGVDGNQMMMEIREQAERFGADIRDGEIVKADLSKRPFILTTDDGTELAADTVIIATGASAKYLGLDDEKKYAGQGVSACATCDGFFYKNQDVAVIGGGDTGCEDADYLSNLCHKVYHIIRRDKMRASKAMQRRVLNNPKIEVIWNHLPEEILGNDIDGVTGVRIRNLKTDEMRDLPISGFFVAIGSRPNTGIFERQLDMDENGYIKVKAPSSRTSIEGVFAAGDVCNPNYKQAIVAAGKGAIAAIDAERYLADHRE